jgi:tripartite-type tricarboxylate transporter receptor subunit TctC
MFMKKFICALATAAVSLSSAAQDYPTQPIRVIVPLSAGSNTDILMRRVLPKMSADLGQPVVLENVPGASAIVGTVQVAKAPHDGYTAVIAVSSAFSLNPHTFKNLPYDPVKDFAPVCRMGGSPYVLAVNSSLGIKTVPELIAKSKDSSLAFASSGAGSITHLMQEMFKDRTGTTFLHVPYKGGPQAVIDTVSGQTQVLFETATPLFGQIRAGKLVALATTSAKRLVALPDVPTFEELGYPGFVMRGWTGMAVPAGTPAPIIDRLSDACKGAMTSPDIIDFAAEQGFQVDYGAPAETAAFILEELSRLGQVARQANIKPE